MNILIIEDEKVVAKDLATTINKIYTQPVKISQLHSVRDAIAYLGNQSAPDLIFSDIQLGDGLCFDIFKAVQVAAPVIFCTAYDEYALDAFKANGIDYILKPFDRQTIADALSRYTQFKDIFAAETPAGNYEKLLNALTNKNTEKASSVLVYHQDKIIPIKLEDIALLYLQKESVHLVTFSGKVHFPNKSLEEVENLTGNHFFRANRQFLVCRKAIIDVSSFFSRKLALNLSIPFKDKITVSKEKTPAFLDWLSRI